MKVSPKSLSQVPLRHSATVQQLSLGGGRDSEAGPAVEPLGFDRLAAKLNAEGFRTRKGTRWHGFAVNRIRPLDI